MGTNFYWRDNPCQHCERYEEIHVGKRSAGWSFGFRAWPHRPMSPAHPEWGFDPQSPFGFPVESRADWRQVFATRPGVLVDEYGRVEEDPVAWLDALEAPSLPKQSWEDHQAGRFVRDGYRDAEGFRFGAYEFS